MRNFASSKYFRVYLHQTSISEVAANDFKCSPAFSPDSNAVYTLPADINMFSDYPDVIRAMEGAKKGALTHIDHLIRKGTEGREELFEYRKEHYDDLNVHLLEANIRRIKNELSLN